MHVFVSLRTSLSNHMVNSIVERLSEMVNKKKTQHICDFVSWLSAHVCVGNPHSAFYMEYLFGQEINAARSVERHRDSPNRFDALPVLWWFLVFMCATRTRYALVFRGNIGYTHACTEQGAYRYINKWTCEMWGQKKQKRDTYGNLLLRRWGMERSRRIVKMEANW